MKRARKSAKKAPPTKKRPARGLWKGSISFGLVNIPISLHSAQQTKRISFHMLDKRDHGRIGYRYINKQNNKEVTRPNIIKAYAYDKEKHVLFTDADLKKATAKTSSTIEIEDFVSLSEVDPLLFERPYYVAPQKGGEKGYALLREVLRKSEKSAIAKVVLHTVQHLAALMVRDDYIILELLRFPNEVIETDEAKFLSEHVLNAKPSEREIKVATQLVEGMTSKWNPKRYHNSYQEDLMKLIQAKIKKGDSVRVEEVPKETSEESSSSNIVDLTSLLKKSLSAARNTKSKRKAA